MERVYFLQRPIRIRHITNICKTELVIPACFHSPFDLLYMLWIEKLPEI